MSKRTRPRRSDRTSQQRATTSSDELGASIRKSSSVSLPAPFYLSIDRQLKSGYCAYEEAEKAALTIKRQYPRIYVTVYETGTRRHIAIGQPRLVVSNGEQARLEDAALVGGPVSATRH